MEIPFKKIDDKVRGIIVDASSIKAMYKTLIEKHEQGVDKAEIKGYTELLMLLDNAFETYFGDKT